MSDKCLLRLSRFRKQDEFVESRVERMGKVGHFSPLEKVYLEENIFWIVEN